MKVRICLEKPRIDIIRRDVKIIKMENKKGLQLIFNANVEAFPLSVIREVQIEEEAIY